MKSRLKKMIAIVSTIKLLLVTLRSISWLIGRFFRNPNHLPIVTYNTQNMVTIHWKTANISLLDIRNEGTSPAAL